MDAFVHPSRFDKNESPLPESNLDVSSDIRLGFSAEKALSLLPRKRIPFVIYNEDETAAFRRGYSASLRIQFIQAAFEECHRSFGITYEQFKVLTENYDIHHKLPSHMGGRNGFDNLVLIHVDFHRAIHRKIDRMTNGIAKINHEYKRPTKRVKTLTREQKLLKTVEDVRIIGRKIFIDIPWPDGKLCIPQFLIWISNLAEGRTDFECHQLIDLLSRRDVRPLNGTAFPRFSNG